MSEILGEIPDVVRGELPEHGLDSLIEEVRRPTGAPRSEVEEAFADYQRSRRKPRARATGTSGPTSSPTTRSTSNTTTGSCAASRPSGPWIKSVMTGPAANMDFPVVHYAIEDDVVYSYILNRFLPASGEGEPFQFPVVTILCYAGDGQWCYEEDVYNPLEGARMMSAVQAAAKG